MNKAQNNPFSIVMPLQHITSVRLIEILWQTPTITKLAKQNFYHNHMPICDPTKLIHTLDNMINSLPLPELLKIKLRAFMIGMIDNAMHWWADIKAMLSSRHWIYTDHKEIDIHFLDNFSWNNTGLADGEKMLQSYADNTDKIEYTAWALLCDYCLEDALLKLTPTIDWQSSEEFCNSPFSVYWYWKIYQKFPTEEMFSDISHYKSYISYSDFAGQCQDGGLYDARHFVENLLKEVCNRTYPRVSPSAVKYLQKELGNFVKFREIFLGNVQLEQLMDAHHWSWLGSADEAWLNSDEGTMYICDLAARWPLCMVSDHCIGVLEGRELGKKHFAHIFQTFSYSISREMRYYHVLVDRVVLGAFKEYVKFFNRTFGADKEFAYKIQYEFFWRRHTAFCAAMFDEGGFDLSKKEFLRRLEGESDIWSLDDEDFREEFMGNVLETDEDRCALQKICDKERAERYPPSDPEDF